MIRQYRFLRETASRSGFSSQAISAREFRFKLADSIEKRVATATVRAEKLTQSILAKTFCVELVPPEAELARREGRSYESSSVLLARIQAKRKATVKLSKGGRAKRARAENP